MQQPQHFFSYLRATMQSHWTSPCMSNFNQSDSDYTYQSLAYAMARLHAQFSSIGIKPGDKIAIAGRNCANWGMTFLAVTSYKAVAVSILPDFTAEDIEKLVCHSEARLLFVGSRVQSKINTSAMPQLLGCIDLDSLSMFFARNEETIHTFVGTGDSFDESHKGQFDLCDLALPMDNMSDLALINYTSGSTGNPKGVMLTHLNISQNIDFAIRTIHAREGDTMLSLLPIAHMFGLMFEFLYPICDGTRIFFLTTQPTPTSLLNAFQQVHPYMMLTVPLVIDKIIRKRVFPVIHRPVMRVLWHTPGIRLLLRRMVRSRLINALGGNLRFLIIGGAALNQEIEQCLRETRMPYCIGYGMTECAPLISYSPWETFEPHSCGRAIENMAIRVDSEDPSRIVGEVQVKGNCVMQGYYRNQQATREVFTEDGWMRTGDLGTIDSEGNLFLHGRCKSMILGQNGQNIYPEEIEDKINSLDCVVESLVVERDGKLVALVLPDNNSPKVTTLDAQLKTVNAKLPLYSQISAFELVQSEFEKTPKKSIKRYLYS